MLRSSLPPGTLAVLGLICSWSTAQAQSPLSSNPAAIELTYLKGGAASSASQTATISSTIPSAKAYVVGDSLPGWLSVTPATGSVSSTLPDSCVFAATAGAGTLTAGDYGTHVFLKMTGQTDLSVTVTLHVVNASLVASPASATLNYVKGGGGIQATSIIIKAATTTTFSVDLATVPPWLSVAGPAGPASSAGAAVTFTIVSAVAANMAVGNYTANVSLLVGGSTAGVIPVSFLNSNVAPTVALKEGTSQLEKVWARGSAIPIPTVTPYSSNEPVPYTATCVVVSSDAAQSNVSSPCTLNGATVASGVAYTWGDALTIAFPPSLFGSTTPFGTTVKITVSVTPGGGSPLSLVYRYTVQPAAATLAGISPTSAAQIPVNTSLVVLLKGNNFVAPSSITSASGLVPTQVFVGSTNTNFTTSSVVLNATQILVTIPKSAFPTFTGKAASAPLAIGVANQTGATAPVAPTASVNLNVTLNPVIYAMTSTASYQQPAPGINPFVAPYELISVFGDNFTASGAIFINSLDTFSRIPTSLTLSGSGSTSSLLKMTFKNTDGKTSYLAPILFANQNQINAIVPSGVVTGAAAVSVSVGTLSSDSFPVTVIEADPGIFTLASDGIGQGAILNQDFTVNTAGNEAKAGDIISIYLTGLGTPDSTAPDLATNPGGFPAGCVAISNATKGTPGYLQVVNTAATGYTPPTPAWTSIDGAAIQGSRILGLGMPPCLATAAVAVTFGSGASKVVASGANILYAGFVQGAVAGLYQINARIPAGVTTGPTVPVVAAIGSASSPASGVTMAIK